MCRNELKSYLLRESNKALAGGDNPYASMLMMLKWVMISIADSELHGVAPFHMTTGTSALEAVQGSRGGHHHGGEAREADAPLAEAQAAPEGAGTAAPLALERWGQRRVTTTDEEGATPKTLHPPSSIWRDPAASLVPPGVGGAANGEQAERSGGGGDPLRAGPAVGERDFRNAVEMGCSPPQVKVGGRLRSATQPGGFFCSLCNTDFEAGRSGRMRHTRTRPQAFSSVRLHHPAEKI